jgi:hypothetical protein
MPYGNLKKPIGMATKVTNISCLSILVDAYIKIEILVSL